MNKSAIFPSSSKNLLWLIAAFVGGILLIGIPLHYFLNVRPRLAEERVDELTVPVTVENLAIRIRANGTVEPVQSVNISPKTPGRLAQLLVEQGDRVEEGQPLAIMDNEELYAQGIRAESQLKGAIASLRETESRVQSGINRAETQLNQAQSRLAEAQQRLPKDIDQALARSVAADANFKRAETKVARFRVLLEEGAISEENFDEVVNEFHNAEAQQFEAQQRLEQAKITANPEIQTLVAAVVEAQINLEETKRTAEPELTRLSAQIEQAQAERQIASVQYQDTIIRAPFGGVITQKFATEGAFVTPTTSASSTASATSSSILALAKGLEVVAQVPEVDIRQLQPGQEVEIVADAYPGKTFRGQVLLISPEAIVENNVTSFEVRIALFSGRDFLRSKMNTEVTFVGPVENSSLTVPTVAIVRREGKTGVLVPDEDNKPEFKPVRIGSTVGDRTRVLSGIQAGDRVFIDLPEDSATTD